MYVHSGYLDNSRIDFKDHSKPLIVGSCGTYRLTKHPRLPTWRPRGRTDFQLLYVAAGKTHFFFGREEREVVVEAGHAVLYQPGEPQKYHYLVEETPEVFWVHFTGYDVRNILNYYHFDADRHIFYVGAAPEYQWIFLRMISELQLCRPLYEEFLASLLNDLLLLMNRGMLEGSHRGSPLMDEMEQAMAYFNRNYQNPMSIEEYAVSRHMSAEWFIRCFKQAAGQTPAQYLLSLRITNAQGLLENSDYSIKEVASIVGYDSPLYFSRVFKRRVGISPAQFRKRLAEGQLDADGGQAISSANGSDKSSR